MRYSPEISEALAPQFPILRVFFNGAVFPWTDDLSASSGLHPAEPGVLYEAARKRNITRSGLGSWETRKRSTIKP